MALRVLLWVARILSIICILLILLFFIGEGFNPQNIAPQEWVGLLFFPLGVVAGMVIAWWREGLGGLITTLSLLAFYLIYGLLFSGRLAGGWAFVSFSAPGFLFLGYWLLKNMPTGDDEE
jgi:hypothetical protein